MSNDKIRRRNKAVVRRMLRAWNKRKESHLPVKLISPALVTHFGDGGGRGGALARSPAAETVLPNEAFPDQRFTEQIVIADDKAVFIAWEFTGTNKGPIYGRPATGRKVIGYGADFLRLEDGLIVEHYDYYSKTRVHVLARLGYLDRKMQRYLINNGLLGRNHAVTQVKDIRATARKFARR